MNPRLFVLKTKIQKPKLQPQKIIQNSKEKFIWDESACSLFCHQVKNLAVKHTCLYTYGDCHQICLGIGTQIWIRKNTMFEKRVMFELFIIHCLRLNRILIRTRFLFRLLTLCLPVSVFGSSADSNISGSRTTYHSMSPIHVACHLDLARLVGDGPVFLQLWFKLSSSLSDSDLFQINYWLPSLPVASNI